MVKYHNEYILKNKLSSSYQNQIINAIKLFFKTIKDTKIDIDKVHHPKASKNLLQVLSKQEVKKILK